MIFLTLSMPDTLTEEKIATCPSCSSEVRGNYCPNCGERSVKYKGDLSLKIFITEAFREVFDVDSRLVRTLRFLIWTPGFLTTEFLKGRRNLYIRPLRLYVFAVVIHFLIFKTLSSADIYNLDRFPPVKFMPHLQRMITEKEKASHRTHEEFIAELNLHVKNNLSVIVYLIVFVAAFVSFLLFSAALPYYVQHLQFVFHIFSFALVRNILMIPFIMMDWIVFTVVVILATQFIYTYLAMRRVFGQTTWLTILKLFILIACIGITSFIALNIAVLIGFEQMAVSHESAFAACAEQSRL